MMLTCWGHSCVTLDAEGGRLVLDPGSFSDTAAALAGAEHVLVTHEHADHLAVGPVAAAAAGGVDVHAPSAVLEALLTEGAPPERLHAVAPGDVLELCGVPVRVGGGTHAEIHPDVPRPVNVGFLVGPVWHPGDSWDGPPGEARVLLVPIGGPWLRVAPSVDLVRAVRPALAIPIHDAMLTEQGRSLPDGLISRLGGAGEYRRLAPGEACEI